MATKTSLLGLTKPAYTDAADVAVLNGNFDLIDKAIVESAWTESLTDNSDFQIWQRGTTFENAPVLQYHADRWRGSGNVLRNYTKVNNGCRVTAQSSSTYMGITQKIPAEKLEPGRYTLVWEFTPSASCKTYNGTEAAAGVRTKEAVAITVTSDNIAAGSRSAEAGIMYMADSSPISAGFYFDVHYVDFYKGAYTTANAPLHHRRGYAAELAECMRYFERLPLNLMMDNTDKLVIMDRTRVVKRIYPTTIANETASSESGASVAFWDSNGDYIRGVIEFSTTGNQYWYGYLDISADL